MTLNLIYSYLFVSDRNNKRLTRDLNRCCGLVDSPTEEVGLRLSVFLRICFASKEAHTLCMIWSKMEFHLTSQTCCHIPYHWDLLDHRTGVILRKIVFPQTCPNLLYPQKCHRGIMISALHAGLRRFAGFNPLLIPWYQILSAHSSLPHFLPIPYPFWRLLRNLDKFPLSVDYQWVNSSRFFSSRGGNSMEFQLTSQMCCHIPYHWDLLDNGTGD